MTKISHYALDSTISDKDKVLGTDFAGSATKNFSIEDLRDYFLESVDSETGLSKTVTITPDQILALDTFLFVEILPAPEAGKAYFIDNLYFHLDFNTTPYDLSGGATLYYYDPEVGNDSLASLGVSNISNSVMNKNEDITAIYPSWGNNVLLNRAVYLVFVSTVSQGDSNMKVKVDYKVIDLSL